MPAPPPSRRDRLQRALRWDWGSFWVVAFFGVLLTLVGAMYVSYELGDRSNARVRDCRTGQNLGRPETYITTCRVELTDGRLAEVEVPKQLPTGSSLEVRGKGTDVESAQTAHDYLWTGPLGLALLAMLAIVGFPRKPHRG
jgi:hypothetical protein